MIDTLPIAIVSRLIEESIDAVLVIDERGAIRYMNEAMHALCGYAPGEALGQPLYGLLPDSRSDESQGQLKRFLEHGEQDLILGAARELTLRHRSGDLIPIEMKALDLGVVDAVR